MNLEELLKKIENELRLRNFSRRTIESYLFCLKNYFYYIKNVRKNPNVNTIKKHPLEMQD